MEDTRQVDELLARIQRLEEQVSRLSTHVGSLAQACKAAKQEIRLSQVAYLGDHRALTYLRSGQKIFVDTRSVDIGAHLMFGGVWEASYATPFLSLLQPSDKVLDIGANHGVYALLAASRVGSTGHVWAFEPSREFCELMRASVSVNGLDNVITIENLAAAEGEFETTLVSDLHWSGAGHLAGKAKPEHSAARSDNALSQTVHCIPLDAYFPDPEIEMNMIKMDIEGAEGMALKGMEKLIHRSRNLTMMLEFAPAMMARFDYGAEFVRQFLESRGFMCWTIGSAGELQASRWDALMSASGNSIQNIFVSRQGLR
jgi:FkbM family methyltransferase